MHQNSAIKHRDKSVHDFTALVYFARAVSNSANVTLLFIYYRTRPIASNVMKQMHGLIDCSPFVQHNVHRTDRYSDYYECPNSQRELSSEKMNKFISRSNRLC